MDISTGNTGEPEYLAMGKPVVSTPLHEVKLFNEQHGGIVAVGADGAEFGKRIEEALCENGAQQARRVEVARENSWSSRIEQMSGLIEKKLRHRSEARELRWQEIFLELYGRARRKVAFTAAVLAFLYFLMFSSPFPWWVAAPLKFADSPRQADAIVVLAGGVGESGKAGQGYEERVKRAVKLFQAGYASHLIFSSGYVFAFEEAEVMKALTVSLGIPAEAILLEKQAGNTYENVKYVSEILNQRGWRTILLVSSPYHMRRVSLVFARQAPDIRVYYTPIENSHFYSHGRGASLVQIQAILHEYLAIVYYRLKGFV